MYNIQDRIEAAKKLKMHSEDRILVLSLIDGKKPLSSTGLVDARLFTGGNTLHAIKDKQTNLWYFKYDEGILPIPLKQHFTSFTMMRKFAEDYFGKRNMAIKEVVG